MRTAAQFAKSGATALGQFTGGPARDYTSRVDIRMFGVFARQTSECRLVGPVTLVDVPALRALPRGIAGVDGEQENSGKNRFVDEKGTELSERPTMQNCSLRFPNSYPIPDSGQFFDRNPSIGAFGCRNDLLTDYVVDVAGEARFLARKKFKPAFRGWCSNLLKFAAKAAMPMSHAFNYRPAATQAVRSASDLSNPKINTEKGCWINAFRLRNIARRGEVELATLIDQIGFATLIRELRELPISGSETNLQPLMEPTNRNSLTRYIPSENAGIVPDRSVYAERALRLFVEFVGICNFSDAPRGNLRRKPKLLAKCRIDQRVKTVLTELLRFPCLFGNPLAALIDTVQCFEQRRALLNVGQQFHFGGEPHSAPPSDVFRALDVPADSGCANVPGGPNVVRRRPKCTAPQLLLELLETDEQLARRAPLQNLDPLTDRNGRREGYKQVNVIWLDFDGQNGPTSLSADSIQHLSQFVRNATGKYALAVLWAPHHVVCRLIHRITTVYDLHRCPHGSTIARLLSWLKPEVSGAEVYL